MNNNKIIDPITGQPIQTQNNMNGETNNIQNTYGLPNMPTINTTNINMQNANANQTNNNQNIMNQTNGNQNIMNQMQNIATIDQPMETFINNTQSNVKAEKNDDTPKVNYVFVAIIFVIILVSIIFLFPYLQKTL